MEELGIIAAETPKTGGRKRSTIYRFNLEYCNSPDAVIKRRSRNSNRPDAGAEKGDAANKCNPTSESATLYPPKQGKCNPESTKLQPGGCTKGYEPEEREPLERK